MSIVRAWFSLIFLLPIIRYQFGRFILQIPINGKLTHLIGSFRVVLRVIAAVCPVAQWLPGGIGLVFIIPLIHINCFQSVKKLLIVVFLYSNDPIPALHLPLHRFQNSGVTLIWLRSDSIASRNVHIPSPVAVQPVVCQHSHAILCNGSIIGPFLAGVGIHHLRIFIIRQRIVAVWAGQIGIRIVQNLCKELWHIDFSDRPVMGVIREIWRNNLRITEFISIPVQPGHIPFLIPVQPFQVAFQVSLKPEIRCLLNRFHIISIICVASVRICLNVLCHFDLLADGPFIDKQRGSPRIPVQNHSLIVPISQGNIDQICILCRHCRGRPKAYMLRRVLAWQLPADLADAIGNLKVQDSILRDLLLLHMNHIAAICGVVGNLIRRELLLFLFLQPYGFRHLFVAGNIRFRGHRAVLL